MTFKPSLHFLSLIIGLAIFLGSNTVFAIDLNSIDSNNPSDWEEPEFLPPEKAFPFRIVEEKYLDTSQTQVQVQIQWEITKGYYLYESSIALVLNNKSNTSTIIPTFDKNALIKFDPNFEKDMAIFKDQVTANFIINTNQLPVGLRFQGCAEAGLCYPMQEHSLVIGNITSTEGTGIQPDNRQHYETFSADFLPSEKIESLLGNASLFKIVLVFLVLGIGLCLTPCVLPMMPIISGLVLGRDKALPPLQAFGISSVYVLTMSLSYTVVGVLAASLGASANIQIWMQHPIILSGFALLFVLLALAMFDVYELRLPQALNQKINDLSSQQNGGSYLSAAFMGVLSAVVVSPCISAPLAGALVFISSTGDMFIGGSALFALGIGMGIPLIALCTFGTSFLPKAGAWLNYSKRFFGLLLLAVSIWMLSRFMNLQLVLALWGALFVFSSFSFGSWQSAHPALKTLQSVLLLWGLVMVLGAALGNTDPLQPLKNITQRKMTNETTVQGNQEKNSLHFKTIKSTQELNKALKENNNSGKILLLDFYADWCTSCKEIEHEIFENPQFQSFLSKTKLVRADLSENSMENFKLLEDLTLFGPPAILFFDDQGDELKALRIQGTIKPENFQKIVNQLSQSL